MALYKKFLKNFTDGKTFFDIRQLFDIRARLSAYGFKKTSECV